MKLVFALLGLVRLVSGECPTSFNVIGECNYAAVSEAADCSLHSELGWNESLLEETVDAICANAVEGNTREFNSITYQGDNKNNFQWDNTYFDGGTSWNNAIETDTEVLRSGDAGSIWRAHNNYASDTIISWPYYNDPEARYIDNFEDCDARVAMCCFVDKRLENDLEPNADICYHDLHDSRHSNHISRGFAVFHEREEKAYCNAISWEADEDSVSARYAGNALFHISMYSGLYEHGYVKNIASSPLCACIEQMATVDNTECTKVSASETYAFTLNGIDLSATLSSEVSYSTCDTDFISHYTSMSTTEESEKLQSKHIVDECSDVNDDFMNIKFYKSGPVEVFVDESEWEIVIGQGSMYSPPIRESDLRGLLNESTNKIIRRICLLCDPTHKDIYYKRITDLPLPDNHDFLDLLMNNWYDTPDNVLNVDFELYSTYVDALEGANKWTFCNYGDEQVGFPRDCGPTRKVNHNWNTYIRSNSKTHHHAFFVEKNVLSQS